jgi:syntaxin 1B/2/3
MNQMGNGVSPESRILNDISDIQRGIQQTSGNLETIKRLQQQSLDDPDASQNTQVNRQLDNLSADTMTQFRAFTERLNKIRAMPDSGSQNCKGPVGSTQSSLKKAMQSYQTVDAEYRKKLQAQMARQYRIVRPEASEQEVREACEDTQSTQVFSQAVSRLCSMVEQGS